MRVKLDLFNYFLAMLFLPWLAQAAQFDIVGPPGSERFGQTITLLPNGNLVVTDPNFDLQNPTVVDVGAVYLYATDGTQISRLTGSRMNEYVGASGVTVLSNGNFVVVSELNNRIAVTWASAIHGVNGVVSSANSLVGRGRGGRGTVTALNNGNYVVLNPTWGNEFVYEAGAITWGNGTTGTIGEISAANSLVGARQSDQVGSVASFSGAGNPVTLLENGNFVVRSLYWQATDNRTIEGAVTWCSGTAPTVGVISAANSLVGSSPNDQVGIGGIFALRNGNYVVSSAMWDKPGPGRLIDAGAVTWGNGATGITGTISAANSLIGSYHYDQVGASEFGDTTPSITELTNGNYVVVSALWDGPNSGAWDAGAVTWGNGSIGITGEISESNSFVGSTFRDLVGIGPAQLDPPTGVTPLTNGNYVFASPSWQSDQGVGGAVTWANGSVASSGRISSANSMVGATKSGWVGYGGVRALSNGNYVFSSYNDGLGAVTWGNGVIGSVGTVSSSNSMVGTHPWDFLGAGGVFPLNNGNYVFVSDAWDALDSTATDVGAVTWGSGVGGSVGQVSAANSLIGTSEGDKLGLGGIIALANGNFVVASPGWDDAQRELKDAGAVTWGSGTRGVVGHVSRSNSLVGSSTGDGHNLYRGSIVALNNGNYVVKNNAWDNSLTGTLNAGAATWGDGRGGTVGTVSARNSLIGGHESDFFGATVVVFTNGNYLIGNSRWDGGNTGLGAATWGNGSGGTTGFISAENSLVGSVASDQIAWLLRELSGSMYAVNSPSWSGGSAENGAITLVTENSAVRGPVSASNSCLGIQSQFYGDTGLAFDAQRGRLIAGIPNRNRVVICNQGVDLVFASGFE